MLLSGIDHVQIAAPAGREQAAREFFGKLLGLEEIQKPEALQSRGGCWFRVGAAQLHIGIEKDFRPAAKAHPAFAVKDAGALFMVLSEAGVHCTWDDVVEDIQRFYATDP